MAFCTDCGTRVPDGINFCTECGKPVEEAQSAPVTAAQVPAETAAPPPSPPQQPQAQPTQTVSPPTVNSQPAFSGDSPPTRGSRYAVMSTGSFFGTMLLFFIPVIGWLACIIMAFASKKLNRRNFARATLIFLIIGILLSVALYFVIGWIAETVMQYVTEDLNGAFGDFSGITGIFDIIKQADSLTGQ